MAGIYKRGNVWWGRIQRKGREHRQSLETVSRDVAEKRFRIWMDKLEAANWSKKPAILYNSAMLHFMENHLPILENSSQRRYITSSKKLLSTFENLYLHQITNKTMSEFVSLRRAEGAAAPTIRRDLACLSSMFEQVIIDWDLEAINPVPVFLKKAKKRGLKESPPRTRYLNIDEETDLLKHAGEYLRPMIAFAIDSGLRLEEQLSLTWSQVNLKRKEITVTKTKNKFPRVVPILPRSAQFPAQHIQPPHYVFHKKDGSRYLKLTRGLAGAAKRAKIKDLRWHDLRRTCGCRLLQDYQMPIEQVSAWLGHQTITQTQRAYAFLNVDSLHKTIKNRTKVGTDTRIKNRHF